MRHHVWAYSDRDRLRRTYRTAARSSLLPLRFINGNSGAVLSTRDNTRHKVRWTALAAAFNVGANLAVIPRWGATGAAVTTVFTEALLCLTYWRLVVSDLASNAPPSGEGSDVDLGA